MAHDCPLPFPLPRWKTSSKEVYYVYRGHTIPEDNGRRERPTGPSPKSKRAGRLGLVISPWVGCHSRLRAHNLHPTLLTSIPITITTSISISISISITINITISTGTSVITTAKQHHQAQEMTKQGNLFAWQAWRPKLHP